MIIITVIIRYRYNMVCSGGVGHLDLWIEEKKSNNFCFSANVSTV